MVIIQFRDRGFGKCDSFARIIYPLEIKSDLFIGTNLRSVIGLLVELTTIFHPRFFSYCSPTETLGRTLFVAIGRIEDCNVYSPTLHTTKFPLLPDRNLQIPSFVTKAVEKRSLPVIRSQKPPLSAYSRLILDYIILNIMRTVFLVLSTHSGILL
jgi:hypothetical protein